MALGPNQYQWPPKRRQTHTEKERETHAAADNIDYGDDNEQSERREDGMLQVMARADDDGGGGGGGAGRRIEWEEEDCRRGRCQT